MTDDLTAAVARLRNCIDGGAPDLRVDDLALVLSALEAAQRDAARWDHLCGLWAHCVELALRQDEDGLWSINMVEAVENVRCESWRGDDPDAAIGAATDGPAADPIADLCKRLRKWYDKERGCVWEAADALERLAREHSKERSGRIAVRAELSAERDRHKRTSERAERAEAERDALRECVRAADAMREIHAGYFKTQDPERNDEMKATRKAYDAARTKVPK